MKFLGCLLMLSSGVAVAQLPSTPPVKMGLWQAEISTKTSGGGYPDEPAKKTIQRACVTPETWKSSGIGKDQTKGCTNIKESYSGRTYSFDDTCPASPGSPGSSAAHLELVFETQELMRISMKMRIDTGDGKSLNMTSTGTSKYVGASCGDIPPGDSKDVE